MATMPHITARVFTGYLQCNTKGQLLSRSTVADAPDFTELLLKRFKAACVAPIEKSTSRSLIQYEKIAEHIAWQDGQSCLIDCATTYVDTSQLIAVQQF